MSSKSIFLFFLSLFSSTMTFAKFEAHEWGTFTSVVGSNGITQNGMNHEDEPLPAFVHDFGELRAEEAPIHVPTATPFPFPDNDPNDCHGKFCFSPQLARTSVITQKMETPVIYFYSDKSMTADVHVKFPEGIITETFPGPVKTFPDRNNIESIANGDTTFSVDILGAGQGTSNLPVVDSKNIYAHARAVNSNVVKSGREYEKYIFYRGIGRFQPRMQITSSGETVSFKAPAEGLPKAAFLVHVDENGHGQMLPIRNLVANQIRTIGSKRIQLLKNHSVPPGRTIFSGETARGMLVDALVSSGLYKDEATAMVNTWENGYLKVPGLRLLYILPNSEVDQILPLKITPAPEKLVRTFIGRIEILLDDQEQQLLSEVIQKKASFEISSLGRFAEPILRRLSELYQARSQTDSTVTQLLTRLIGQASNFEDSDTTTSL